MTYFQIPGKTNLFKTGNKSPKTTKNPVFQTDCIKNILKILLGDNTSRKYILIQTIMFMRHANNNNQEDNGNNQEQNQNPAQNQNANQQQANGAAAQQPAGLQAPGALPGIPNFQPQQPQQQGINLNMFINPIANAQQFPELPDAAPQRNNNILNVRFLQQIRRPPAALRAQAAPFFPPRWQQQANPGAIPQDLNNLVASAPAMRSLPDQAPQQNQNNDNPPGARIPQRVAPQPFALREPESLFIRPRWGQQPDQGTNNQRTQQDLLDLAANGPMLPNLPSERRRNPGNRILSGNLQRRSVAPPPALGAEFYIPAQPLARPAAWPNLQNPAQAPVAQAAAAAPANANQNNAEGQRSPARAQAAAIFRPIGTPPQPPARRRSNQSPDDSSRRSRRKNGPKP